MPSTRSNANHGLGTQPVIAVISVDASFNLKHEDHKSVAREKASDILDACKLAATAKLHDGADFQSVVAEMSECMSGSVVKEFVSLADEVSFQSQVRKSMAGYYENFTCADYDLPTSPSQVNQTWFDRRTRLSHPVQVLLDQPASKVHLVDNFISDEQCAAMENAAKNRLAQAFVADGGGGFEISKARKAMQAGIHVNWAAEASGDPIATISRKVYDYVNHATGLNIDEKGQEDLMSIQYFGRGENDTDPDHYKPHCDGECTGDPHKHGNRVATIVMYCEVPTKGGATNFRNAGLHVRPKRGRAVFFSYMNPETHIMDQGFTEHSGCPVIEGEKKIVTQWVRYGVTAEVPWSRYDSCKFCALRCFNCVVRSRSYSAFLDRKWVC